ncbi:hypothetical protein WICMUC_003113 [Wickerhamomyces mucosus]|uniref:Elongator complex protein 6 n=1 Tax=Wickerhamomyces mucosus TaxID=1378264 RepID=A0A9P8PNG8_9ASCO|nr:hypothetical protein WICMUC_003113 [Wickerhamomyces mucosus]
MSSQKQDLHIFTDNSIIPHNQVKSEHLFNLITHVQGTSPTWLLNLLIENSLYGTCSINTDTNKQHRSNTSRSSVIFISFLNDFKFYASSLKKNGVEVQSNQSFKFIDLFTNLFDRVVPSNIESVSKLFDDLTQEIKNLSQDKPIIFIEGLEFLLLSTDISSIQCLSQLNKLHKLSSSVILSCQSDEELIDIATFNHPTHPQYKLHDFLVRILHRTNLNIALRPLETGKAKDITGTLSISKGCIPYESLDIAEKEYLYLVSKDQSAKLFFR